MSENFSYPMNPDWSTEELICVMDMWQKLDEVYEKKVSAEDYLETYKEFKKVVRSIGEERQLGRDYEEMTGHSLYRISSLARKQKTGVLKRKDF